MISVNTFRKHGVAFFLIWGIVILSGYGQAVEITITVKTSTLRSDGLQKSVMLSDSGGELSDYGGGHKNFTTSIEEDQDIVWLLKTDPVNSPDSVNLK